MVIKANRSELQNRIRAMGRGAIWALFGAILVIAIHPLLYLDNSSVDLIRLIAKLISPVTAILAFVRTLNANSKASILLAADQVPEMEKMVLRSRNGVKKVLPQLKKGVAVRPSRRPRAKH